MTRALFWLALAFLIVFAVRSKMRKLNQGAGDAAAKSRAGETGEGGKEGEAMACCAHCHVYFPASEALRAGGLAYCSQAHVGLPEQ